MRTGLAAAGAACLLVAGLVIGCDRAEHDEVGWRWNGGEVRWGGGRADRGERSEVIAELPGISSVRLDRTDGDVVVRHVPGGRGEVRERARDRPPDAAVLHRVEGGVLVLPGCPDDCSVDYEVDLPAAVPVEGGGAAGALEVDGMASARLEAGAGEVRISEVAGPVRVRSGAGGVELRELGGDVAVSTGTGRIDGEGLAGANVVAEARTGSIDLELTAPRSVRAETGTGTVAVVVPDGAYRVDAAAGLGSQDVEVATDPGSPRRLDLRTGTGSVRVSAA
ncbi:MULTISPECIES: hypothetical protein [unclassified Saccharopolyspora]|uniref:hypothetical protein n=1 Tax=unclassified Saccharopolyspora TaxID=2646250 RepID=UPI001CD805A4|nr:MULTISPECIES: hypothetical protein [unclassified Saccharopolyspora]MCA1188380.1 hypothetical protein [Saccharopolyspora sp. 6T]MCA1194790.1 hypothetical protein [Saccharopolyspora sp. 6V]MCA1228242.1 hypothetical protein [Saccharopolyspora sp. 6M]MCA1281308.1 hypothetical protein [Saccharopolyspora sp. 7B]